MIEDVIYYKQEVIMDWTMKSNFAPIISLKGVNDSGNDITKVVHFSKVSELLIDKVGSNEAYPFKLEILYDNGLIRHMFVNESVKKQFVDLEVFKE